MDVGQVFCVGLWCLDDYWLYSVFTLFMLVLFESTVVNSRLRTLTELRRVRVDSQTLMVHRGGKYVSPYFCIYQCVPHRQCVA
jgi:cation-transporting ATPase 13A1